MINYDTALNYLDAIAALGKNDIASSPHGVWWQDSGTGANLTYAAFNKGTIMGAGIAPSVPILEPSTPGADKSNSFFFRILLKPDSYGGKLYEQMPKAGPFINDTANPPAGVPDPHDGSILFTLSDGTTVTGKKIEDDLREWLKAGAPK